MNRRLLPLLALTLAACASAELSSADACRTLETPEVEGHSGRHVFVVDAACGGGDAGTRDQPFNGLQAALDGAEPGDTVVLGAGRWEGSFVVPAGVNLAGQSAERSEIRGSVRVDGDGDTTLQGLTVRGAQGPAVRADAGTLRLIALTVRDAADAGDLKGHGVATTGVRELVLQRTRVVDNAGVGVLARGAEKVSIIEPIYAPSPRGANGKFGIIEPIYLPRSAIVGNGTGGVAIIEPIYSPDPTLRLESTLVKANGGFGVGLWGASAKVVNSAVVGTKVGPGGPWADGIMVAAAATEGILALDVDKRSVVLDNARTGVSALARTDLTLSADVSGNALCGVWAGGSSQVSIAADAIFAANILAGVAATGGSDLTLEGAVIRGTRATDIGASGADAEAGDGIGVFDGARATIIGARLVDNARAGVLVHQAATKRDGSPDVTITGSTVSGGKYAVVVNGSPAPSFAADNSYEASSEPGGGQGSAGSSSGGGGSSGGTSSNPPPADRDDANMPVKTEICEGEGCAPSF